MIGPVLVLVIFAAVGSWPALAIDPEIEKGLYCSDYHYKCGSLFEDSRTYGFLSTLALPAENTTAGIDLQSVGVRGPCVLAEGLWNLMTYAPNASIDVTTENLVFNGGAVHAFSSLTRRVRIFANKVTITSVPGLQRHVTIRLPPSGMEEISLRDLLGNRVDGDTYRPLMSEAQNLSLNLGYMADDASTLLITTPSANTYRQLPQLRNVFSYDLSLAEYYNTCSDSRIDCLNLQMHACDAIKIPVDEGAVYPQLPFFCHTPYFLNKTGSDFFTGQDPDRTRVHILDWDMSGSLEVFHVSSSISTFVANRDTNIVTDLATYTWSLSSSIPPRSHLCRDNFTSFRPDILRCPSGRECANLIMERLNTTCSDTMSNCPEVLNTMWEASTLELAGLSRTVVHAPLSDMSQETPRFCPDPRFSRVINVCWGMMMLSDPKDVSFNKSSYAQMIFLNGNEEAAKDCDLAYYDVTQIYRDANSGVPPGELTLVMPSLDIYLDVLDVHFTVYLDMKSQVYDGLNAMANGQLRKDIANIMLIKAKEQASNLDSSFQELKDTYDEQIASLNATLTRVYAAEKTFADSIEPFNKGVEKYEREVVFRAVVSTTQIFSGMMSGFEKLKGLKVSTNKVDQEKAWKEIGGFFGGLFKNIPKSLNDWTKTGSENGVISSIDKLNATLEQWVEASSPFAQVQVLVESMQAKSDTIIDRISSPDLNLTFLTPEERRFDIGALGQGNLSTIYKAMLSMQSLSETTSDTFSSALKNSIGGSQKFVAAAQDFGVTGYLYCQQALNILEATSALITTGTQLISSKIMVRQAHIALDQAESGMVNYGPVGFDMWLQVQAERFRLLSLLNEACHSYIFSTALDCPLPRKALTGEMTDDQLRVYIPSFRTRLYDALSTKPPQPLNNIVKTVSSTTITDELALANLRENRTLTFDIALDEPIFRRYYAINLDTINVVFKGLRYQKPAQQTLPIILYVISTSGTQLVRGSNRQSITFRGPSYEIFNAFNTQTLEFVTQGKVYPDNQQEFYMPSPFTTWNVFIPEGSTSNLPGTIDLSGVVEVSIYFSGKANSVASLGPPSFNPCPRLPIPQANCSAAVDECARTSCRRKERQVRTIKCELCRLSDSLCLI